MSVVRLGINGFGRIGRLTFRAATASKSATAQVAAINDPNMDVDYLIYLLKYDSVHGRYEHDVKKVDGGIEVNGHKIKLFSEKDPANIKWGDAGADYVCESTGVFTD
jgi:glyceraldehyde 3-phosphate dehydrogenase